MMVLHFILLAGLVYLVFYKTKIEFKKLFWFAWLFRMAMGVALGLVYTYYYQEGDSAYFFNKASQLGRVADQDIVAYVQYLFNINTDSLTWSFLTETDQRSLFLIKIISVFSIIGGGNYWVCAFYFSTISFLAAWYLFQVVVKYFEQSRVSAALSFLFFPSVVFWSSGVVKETLALSGIFWMSAILIGFLKKEPIPVWHWLLTMLACWVVWNLKYYWMAVFIAVVFVVLGITVLQSKWLWAKRYWLPVWLLLLVIICTGASQLHPNFYFSHFLEVIVENHYAFERISEPGNLIGFYNVHASWWSLIVNVPWALLSGLFRPFVFEAQGITGFVASIENLVLLLLFATAFFKKPKSVNKELLAAVVTYVVLLCVFLAISTPNFGTLSRYRIGFLPFFVFVISYRNPLLQYLARKLPFCKK